MTIRQGTDPLDEHELKSVLAKVEEIATVASNGGHIFRGESEVFASVSSGLFRQYRPNRTDPLDVEDFQSKILAEARRFTPEKDDAELLSQLQHFESGLTNLIDFTTDYHVALFFACEGALGVDGRVVMLRRESADTFDPAGPLNRVIAQKSIFVRPPAGFVEPEMQVSIPAHLKPSVLKYLATNHGVNPQSIYNDLHGFIRHWSINRHANDAYFAGITQSAARNHVEAIESFNEALALQPSYRVYFERGNAFLAIRDWESAIDDFNKVEWPALGDTDVFMSGAACNGRGVALRKQHKYAEAADDFKTATTYFSMRYAPDFIFEEGEAYSNLVVTLMEMGDYASASKYAAEARRRGYDPSSTLREDYGDIHKFESSSGSRVPVALAQTLSDPADES